MKLLDIHTTNNNSIQYFIDGLAILDKILELIDSAKESIYVEVFLFYDDETGRKLATRLIEKAEEGLDVRVLLSEKGSEFNKSQKLLEMFRKSKVKLIFTFPLPKLLKDIWNLLEVKETKDEKTGERRLHFHLDDQSNRKISLKSLKIQNKIAKRCEKGKERAEDSFWLRWKRKKILRSLTFYDHRKIVLVDKQRVFLGGMNFGNDYFLVEPCSPLGFFHDIGIRIEGDTVQDVFILYMQIWHLFNPDPTDIEFTVPAPLMAADRVEGVKITTLSSFPKKFPNEIRQAYLESIRKATKYAYLINLYLTDSEIIDELIAARNRGADVRFISTFLPTNKITSWFTRQLYKGYFYLIFYKKKLQDHGILLYHYTKHNVHAKVAMTDNQWVTIGSSNLDYSSLRNAMEINVTLSDEQFIENLRKDLFEKDFTVAGPLNKKLNIFQKIYYFICYCVYMISEKYFI